MMFPGFAFLPAPARAISQNRLDWCGRAGQDRTMAAAQNPQLADAIAGALDWWRDAGVDCAFVDDPVSWLSEKAPAGESASALPEPVRKQAVAQPKPVAVPAIARLDPASLPATLEMFTPWWMSEPMLADGPMGRRVAPRGAASAELMVVVPEPEREDEARLLSGAQGKLLDAMLPVFGLDTEQVYFASALPRHLPGADWSALAASGIGDVLARHVALVAPKRLIVFGASVLPLVSHDPPQGPADLRIFNHDSVNVPMLACRSLAALLEQPRWKARVWQAWLEMTA
jgi:DNA polymerase